MSGADREAGGQAFDVPFPGADQRLVEVVEVEDEPPVRRVEEAEVGEVGVAADLGPEAARWGGGQVGRHDVGGAAVEGEHAGGHAAVAERHQRLEAAHVGRLDHRHGVRAIVAGGPAACEERGTSLRHQAVGLAVRDGRGSSGCSWGVSGRFLTHRPVSAVTKRHAPPPPGGGGGSTRLQLRALAFRASYSDWLIAPLSSSSLAWAISAAEPPLPAVADIGVKLGLGGLLLSHRALGHAAAPGQQVDEHA